ncbi:MAG: ABC transporter permease [Nanoarchaeota archaeon]|nr:ABC transporter permease [Nanoarchaeota archaeon]
MNLNAVYVMWLREMKRFSRSKSRMVSMLIMPLLFLGGLGFGFSKMTIPGIEGIAYLQFLVPGIVGMGMLFSSTGSGVSVLWDKEFGFLKEIMVAPVSRTSIVLGRIAGGATISLTQGILLILISTLLGFRTTITGFLIGLIFMALITTTFIGLGLILASRMKDMQGFQLIINFVVMPLFFLSGALYPIENLPAPIRILSYANPLTYGLDGLRGALIGISRFHPLTNLTIMITLSVAMVSLGAFLFDKSDNA